MRYELYYTDDGVIRASPFPTLEDALAVFNSVAKRFSPAWIYGPDGKVAFGDAPAGFTRSAPTATSMSG